MKFVHFETTTSTMDEAKKLLSSSEEIFVTADSQTSGRGRRGNTWSSKKGSGIYGTYACNLPFNSSIKDSFDLSGLSLAIGVALIDGLALAPLGVRLKWPNDLVHEASKKKVGGILIESVIQGDQVQLLIGVGINLTKIEDPALSQIASSLEEVGSTLFDLEKVKKVIAEKLKETVECFLKDTFSPFKSRFNELSVESKLFSVSIGDTVINGHIQGVSDSGALLLHDGQTLHTIVCGHVESW